MNKNCILCEESALYKIKDTADYYCEGCAKENFGELSYLESLQ